MEQPVLAEDRASTWEGERRLHNKETIPNATELYAQNEENDVCITFYLRRDVMESDNAL